MNFFHHQKNWASRLISVTFSLFLITEPVYAISLTQKLGRFNPLSSSAYAAETSVQDLLDKGAKLYREGKWGDAIEIWKEALTLDPQNRKAKRYIERAKQKLSQSQGISEVKSAKPTVSIIKKPETDDPLREGILLYREGKYSQAIKIWNKVLAKETKRGEV